jgi:hypothetical protein
MPWGSSIQRMTAVASAEPIIQSTGPDTTKAGLVVLTREAGKNDKLRERLNALQVSQ